MIQFLDINPLLLVRIYHGNTNNSSGYFFVDEISANDLQNCANALIIFGLINSKKLF